MKIATVCRAIQSLPRPLKRCVKRLIMWAYGSGRIDFVAAAALIRDGRLGEE